MKKYGSKITLSQTSRGVWSLDTVKGCTYGMALDEKGCYGACYANSIALRYGYNFSNSTIRCFGSKRHIDNIVYEIKTIDADFIRIGVMGDPSECWGHTIDICDKVKNTGKQVVIVTKHWNLIPDYLYTKVNELGLIINTSISALDSDRLIRHRLSEYKKLKSVCKSILRVVSCDFNLNNLYGIACDEIQKTLLCNDKVIDTVLRLPSNHYLIENGIVNTSKEKFMSNSVTASVKNKNTHLGYCGGCGDKCGVSL